MSSQQQTLSGRTIDVPDHLSEKLDDINHPTKKDREYGCRECRRRVTQSVDRLGEYGHAVDCSHHFQRGDAR